MQFEGDAPDLAGVPGVSAVAIDGTRLTCDLDGDPKPLLAALASLAVSDLLIEPARLEDAFLELYAADEEPESDADPGAGRGSSA